MYDFLTSLLRYNSAILDELRRMRVTDPSPEDRSRGWGRLPPMPPDPITDPVPYDYRGAFAGAPEFRASVAYPPPWVTDPGPDDFSRSIPGLPRFPRWPTWWPSRPDLFPRPVDPSPIDSTRLNAVLELDIVEFASRLLRSDPGQLTLEDIGKVRVSDLAPYIPVWPTGPNVDPMPDDLTWSARDSFSRFPGRDWPSHRPHWVDPAPSDPSHFRELLKLNVIEALQLLSGSESGAVKIDDLRKIRIRELIKKLVGPHTDPAPDPYFGSMLRLHPDAIARMDPDELNVTRHRIEMEVTRLRSFGEMVNARLSENAKKGKKK